MRDGAVLIPTSLTRSVLYLVQIVVYLSVPLELSRPAAAKKLSPWGFYFSLIGKLQFTTEESDRAGLGTRNKDCPVRIICGDPPLNYNLLSYLLM